MKHPQNAIDPYQIRIRTIGTNRVKNNGLNDTKSDPVNNKGENHGCTVGQDNGRRPKNR